MPGFIQHVIRVFPDGVPRCINCGISMKEVDQLVRLCPNSPIVCHMRPNYTKAMDSFGGRKKAEVVFNLLG